MKKNVLKIGLASVFAFALFTFASCSTPSSSGSGSGGSTIGNSIESATPKADLIAKLPTQNVLSNNPLKGNTYVYTEDESSSDGVTTKTTHSYSFTEDVMSFELTQTSSFQGMTSTTKTKQSGYYNLTGTTNNITINAVIFDCTFSITAPKELLSQPGAAQELEQMKNEMTQGAQQLIDKLDDRSCTIDASGNLTLNTMTLIKQ